MTEAWRGRDIERRRLLEELIAIIWHLEDEQEKSISLELASVIIKYLKSRQDSSIIVNAEKHSSGIFHLFFDRILPKIESFARAEEERDALIGRLLKNLIEHQLGRIESELLAIEIRNPQLIFGADSAMTEQELPEED